MRNTIEMAKNAGFNCPEIHTTTIEQRLERFEALVRADEREACAKVCEDNATDLSEGDWDIACNNCADHIRNRENT